MRASLDFNEKNPHMLGYGCIRSILESVIETNWLLS
jgi:hypothetical protein